MQIKISLGTNTQSNLVKKKILSFDEVAKLLTTYRKVSDKTDLPYFIAGHFRNNIRSTINLESRTLIVLDIDKIDQDLNTLIEILNTELHQYKYLVYSTISHTPLAPKIRIIFFLTKEIPVNKYSEIVKNFVISAFINNSDFLDDIDSCSFKPNQFMYLPGYITDSYEKFTRINEGELINPDDFDTHLAVPYEFDSLLSIVANKPLNLTNKEIQNYLDQYDVTSTDYYAWIQTGMALHHQFEGSRYGCTLWGKWSLKDPRYEEIDIVKQVKEKWKSFSTNNNNPVTFASIIKIINEQKGKSPGKINYNIERLCSDIWCDTEGKHKRPLCSPRNLEILLKAYNITVQYDIIAKEEIITTPNQISDFKNQANTGYKFIKACCIVNKINISELKDMISLIAAANQINPFLDWIKSTPWDKKSRLNDFYDTVKTIDEQNELKKIYLKKWCMSVIQLSCLNDDLENKFTKGILIFQGKQSVGKTPWFRALLPKELRKYQDDGITIDPNDKDSVLACIKNVMVELGEIDSTFRKTDIARFKQFITKTNDTLRLKYDARHSTFTRQTVFFGSVNDHKFLVDETGNTRFMILSVLNVNHNHQINMQQFWAEIYHYCEQNEQYWLTDDEVKQQEIANKNYEQLCPYEEKIRLKFDMDSKDEINMSATRILEILDYTNITKRQTNDMAKTLDKMGFKRGSSYTKGWYLPPEKNMFDFENNN